MRGVRPAKMSVFIAGNDRQNSRPEATWLQRYERASRKTARVLDQRPNQQITNDVGDGIFRADLNDTRAERVRDSEDVSEIEIVCEHDHAILSREIHDHRIVGSRITNG